MKILALMKRIVQQFLEDKRSLALLLIAPLFALTLLWIVLDMDEYEPEIAVTDIPVDVQDELESKDVSITEMAQQEAEEALQQNSIDAHLYVEEKRVHLMMEGSNPSATQAVQRALSSAMQALNPQSMDVELEFLHGSEDLKLFDNTGPTLIGLFVFLFVFLLSGVTFLRERTQGTLERLLATPIRRWEIVAGYIGGFGIFIVLQAFFIVLYSVYVLGMYMEGSMWAVLVIAFLLALTAQSLGTLLSAYAKNEFQMIQFVPIVIVPQVFFSGVFQTEQVEWIHLLSKIMPLTYGGDALKEIMLRGQSLGDVWLDVCVLLGFSILFIGLNMAALKKHRKL